MKTNFLSLTGMRLKGRSMNDPAITRKSRGNHPVITRFSRLITSTLLLLFTFAIGQMWGTCDPGTIFKFEVKDGLTNGNIAAGNPVNLSSYVTVTAGTVSAYGQNAGSLAIVDEKAISIAKKAEAYFIFTLSEGCSLQEGDVIKYIIYNKNALLQPETTTSDAADKLTLTKTSNVTTYGSVVIPAGHALIGESTFYLFTGDNACKIKSVEISRPATITLDATTNGGSVSTTSLKGVIGDKVGLPHAFKTGKKFKGWYTTADGDVKKNDAYTIAGDITLYAQFEDLPVSGEMFSLTMEDDLKPAAQCTIVSAVSKANQLLSPVELTRYATISGGSAVLSNSSTSNHAFISNSTASAILNGGSGCLTITLESALQVGDVITTSIASQNIAYTVEATRSTATNFVKGDDQTLTVTSESPLKGKSVIYLWNGSSSGGALKSITITRPAPAATYTVTLNPAGGAIDPVPSGWTYDDVNDKYIKADVEDGSSVALLALTKDGYKLNGWKDGENADYTSPVTIDGADLTLTAQWAQTYAVTYVPNNSVLPAETMTDNNAPYKAGDEVTLLANTFTAPENKEFDEWVATYNDGEVKTLTITAGKFTMPAYPVTVTATWKDACALAPTVSATTLGTTSYTTQVVNCAGISVLGSAGCTISEYGFVYGTTTAPTISNNKKALEGDYTVAGTAFPATTLTGLAMNTKYYVRAYATNSFGTAYGAEVEFTTLESLGNVLVVASSASQTSDAITALRDNGFMVTVSAHDNSRSYTGYDLVVLDESLGGSDAQTITNEESKIKDVNIPILNLKAFFYTKTNRWNWGTPVNGTSGNEIANISTAFCNAQSHPIFAGLTINDGEIDLIDPAKSGNTLQGVTTNTLVEGKEGYTLATSGTGITFIHELTPAQRGVTNAKYLMIALSSNIKDNLSDDAKKMIVNAAKYLVGSIAWTPVEGLGTTTIDATGNPFSEGATMTLTASATGATASTTYAWYKGDTWAEAEAAGTIQAAKTAENSGHIYTKTAASEDAGTYWCVMVKSTGCEATASVEVSVVSCTKPGTPANLVASDFAYTTANLSWDACDNSNGYKITIIKKSDESVIVDWTACATNSYAATGLTQGTEYTFKVKAVGATGYCEYGLEASKDFTTTAPSVADLVTIADDWTFTPSATITAGTLAEDNKLFASGADDCDYNGSGMRIKENRALAFNVNNGAKVKVTFGTNGDREMKLGTAMTGDDSKVYGHSKTSPVTFDVTADGVVYLTSTSDLRFTKMEIMYPHTVTYDLNGGTGTLPTQEAKYVGETFTAHDGTTDITAPTGKEFSKWKDQDEADVLGGATYTMPAKAVTLTAQWIDPPTRYTVSFDLQGHGSAITSQSVADGEKALKPADPSESGWEFEGWYTDAACTAGNEFDFNTAIIADRPLFAKWTEFDACAVLTPATSGETIGVGDAISLQAGSVGGTMEAVVKSGSTSTTLAYTENGLSFGSSGNTSRVKVTLSHKLQKGSIIRVTLKANGENTSDRGLDLYNEAEAKKDFLGFAKNGYENGDVAKFSYVVTDDDGLKNTKIFYLYRNNSVWMADLKVANCAPQDFTVTYKDGETTLGTEDVFENGHPTAAGVNTRKNGYVFDGWAETDGGAVVNLSTITITAAKTLYAKYSERVCPTSGKIFSLNMDKTVSTEVNVKSGSINLDGYATISGGTATLANTSNDTRAKVTTTPSIRFSDGNQGYLQVDLDCPISEGDIIRYVNTNSGKIAVRTAHGTSANETILEGNKSEITTVEVNAALDGLYTIFVERKDNTSDLKYFEIYRRPALTGVSLADLTVREGASATPIMTLSPSNDAAVTSQAWSILSGNDKISINPTTGEVTGVAEGDAVVKVILNGDAEHFSATANVHVVETFTQINVDKSTVWDFSKAGEVSSAFSEQILANVDGVTLDAAQFNARQLVGTAQNITTTYFQGTMLSFNADIAGLLTVKFTNGNSNIRKLRVYDKDDNILAEWEYSNASTQTKSIEVPAGKVTLRSFQGDAPNNVRVMKMEFFALAYTRADSWMAPGELGTICYPEGLVAVGADLYKMTGVDENKKFVFDEVTVTLPGVPYLFEAQANVLKFYATTATAADAAGTSNGMVGTFSQIIIPQSTPNTYYFSGKKFYAVNKRTTDLTVPANRAYVDLNTPVLAGAPRHGVRRITFDVQEANIATGLENGELMNAAMVKKVLINGELFILRGEKMYDAKGQLVK